ncbi:MAG: hypothetical protein M1496_02295 [Candidatus Thermoplasmatota archaeon]|nr:hypothetical protein [Candidatus Thermoplasmatota archaeon]
MIRMEYINKSLVISSLYESQGKFLSRREKVQRRKGYRNAIMAGLAMLLLLSVVTSSPVGSQLVLPVWESTTYFSSAENSVSVQVPDFLYYYATNGHNVDNALIEAVEHATLAGLLSAAGISLPATTLEGLLTQALADGLDAAGITDALEGVLLGLLPWYEDWMAPAIIASVAAFVVA